MRIGILGSGADGWQAGNALGARRTRGGIQPKRVPEAQAVSAFNTVPSEVLLGVFEARRKAGS